MAGNTAPNAPTTSNKLVVMGFLAMNIVASVTMVLINKKIFIEWPHAPALTFFHFVTTAIVLEVFARLGHVERSDMAWQSWLKVATLMSLTVPLSNLALRFNSVGFFQISKVLVTPFTVAIQYFKYGKSFTREVIASLVVVCVGALVTTVTNPWLTMIGLLIALVAIFTSAVQQVLMHHIQVDEGVTSQQLLKKASPFAAVELLVFLPVLDDVSPSSDQSVWAADYSFSLVGAIAATCGLAVLYQISLFAVVGKASPVSFQVAGYLKMCLIVVLGFMLFNQQPTAQNIVGIVITIAGVVLYSYLKQHPDVTFAKLFGGKAYQTLEEGMELLEADLESGMDAGSLDGGSGADDDENNNNNNNTNTAPGTSPTHSHSGVDLDSAALEAEIEAAIESPAAGMGTSQHGSTGSYEGSVL